LFFLKASLICIVSLAIVRKRVGYAFIKEAKDYRESGTSHLFKGVGLSQSKNIPQAREPVARRAECAEGEERISLPA